MFWAFLVLYHPSSVSRHMSCNILKPIPPPSFQIRISLSHAVTTLKLHLHQTECHRSLPPHCPSSSPLENCLCISFHDFYLLTNQMVIFFQTIRIFIKLSFVAASGCGALIVELPILLFCCSSFCSPRKICFCLTPPPC